MAVTKVSPDEITPYAKFRAFIAANFNIPNGAWTALPWASETYDTHGMHDTATNNTRVTIQPGQEGWYLLQGQVQIQFNGTGGRGIKFVRNGQNGSGNTGDGGGTFENAIANYQWRRQVTGMWYMVPGDYVELMVFQNSGGVLTADVQGAETELGTWFSVTRMP